MPCGLIRPRARFDTGPPTKHTNMNTDKTTTLEGLDAQLRILEDARDDPLLADNLACMVCFRLADECTCNGSSVLWPLPHVVFRLQQVLGR